MSSKENYTGQEAEESLLYSARHGELTVVKALLEARRERKLTLNIDCRGKNKTNLGWTPLHLATYFRHKDVVEVLLDAGANVDEVNDTGDTALHKAAFIGDQELVILLLNYRADVNIMNGEGRTAEDVCNTPDVQRLLEAAGLAERRDKERKLLNAAREGRIDDVQELLSSPSPPNINCVDAQGNTCLHCVAYRGHARVAVLLLQNGVDTTLRNNRGQLAIDLSKDNEMREVLSVRPVQRLQRTAQRHEGPLLKRSRFLGWRPIWVRRTLETL
nr:oxysterol-binding protein-related protein 1-like [Danaus plexippus plexippus]